MRSTTQGTPRTTRTKRTKSAQPPAQTNRFCNKPAKPLPRYWGIRFACGGEVQHLTAPLAAHCCPHCLADSLIEFGLLQHGAHGGVTSPLRFDCWTPETCGMVLVRILLEASIEPSRHINLFFDGGRC